MESELGHQERLDQRKREVALVHSRKRTDTARDIGPPPDIVDEGRRDDCRHSLKLFCETYQPHVFYLGWSVDHEMMLAETQRVAVDGGKVCVAMPRGSGKTSIFQAALIWATLYGHQPFTILLMADASNFQRMLGGIKTIMETNRLLLEDFPEVIHPIRCLGRTATRAPSQLCCGTPTYIKWGIKALQFADTEWSRERGNASACMGGGGLGSSAIRGQVMALPSGELLRPTLALVDDPQTRKIAKSDSQCQELEDTIKGDICGMSGPDSEMNLMMACTVISTGDLADRILDPQRNPQITSMRVATIKTWPDNMSMWEKYDEVRRQEQLGELDPGASREFYKTNREKMDAGCQHYWPERQSPNFESAIENSMAQYFEDPKSFMSERQNDPSEEFDGEFVPLNPLELARRTAPTKRGVLPADTEYVTAFVDVQKRLLYFTVVAWNKGFGGTVIDYGVWPKVRRRHFTYATLTRPTLSTEYGSDDEESIKMGLVDLLTALSDTTWQREDGALLSLTKSLVDCGYLYDVVEAALIHSGLRRTWIPARGIGIGAKDTPMKAYRGMAGVHWVMRKPDGRFLPSVMVDTNYWKSQLYDSLRVLPSHPIALRWYKEGQSHHQMLSDHCVAERAVRVESKGRKIDEWEQKPNKPDNHLSDCLVGCLVGASLAGLRRKGQAIKVASTIPKRRTIKL